MKLAVMRLVMTIVFVVIMSATLYADDTLKRFTQPTLEGKTVRSEALKGTPLVINFSGPE